MGPYSLTALQTWRPLCERMEGRLLEDEKATWRTEVSQPQPLVDQ